ncbi:MAG TPA: multidrug DMT transporter permease [Anaerolineae bacterium]|nr:multidrug DMT transporter permease [Anaerolineae bacterium]
MSITAVLLILVSAATHVGWNFINKREHPTAAFLLLANTLGCLLLLPAILIGLPALGAYPTQVWCWLGITGIFQAVYYAGLAGAYRNGDMSIAYPLARATPVVWVALVNLALGADLRLLALGGMGLIVIGSLILPLPRLSDFRPRNYAQATTRLALVAALGTTGYSLCDSHALALLRNAPGMNISSTLLTMQYAFLEGMMSSAWLALWVLARAEERAHWRNIVRVHRGRAALAGAGIHIGYTLVLIAMAFAANVSYVVAFRQISIPLGALVGVLALKEPSPRPKLIGVALMSAGLVLVAVA